VSWLLDAADVFIRVLQCGGTLPWTYEGTPYEKEIDPEGITTNSFAARSTSAGVVPNHKKAKEIGILSM